MERDCCQWLADLQSDVPSVQETAWKDLSRIVFRVACAYLQRRSDTNQSGIEQLAEDVAQEALADIFNGLDRFSRNSKLTTWAYSVVVNNARELLRKGRASEPYWPSLDDDETATRLEIIPDPQVCDPELQAEEEELVRTVQEVINTRLTERQRAVLLLYQAGHTLPEIATRVGTTRNNVDQLLYAARRRLKKELRNRGHDVDYK
jgi:RNA polymerase sigma-70 factor (ECF subfamily)